MSGYVPWWEWAEGKRPPGWTEKDEAHWRGDDLPVPEWWGTPYVDKAADYGDPDAAAEARRGIRAMELAPTLEIYEALMRGDDVPLDRLNRDAVLRYGLRKAS